MGNLKHMVIFYHVVKAQSFSGAARQLGIARSAVSRYISLLEADIGTRLLNRTTRQLSLTEAGKIYFESCARIAEEVEVATERVSQLQDEPQGTLKVAAPISLGNKFIVPLVRAFINRYTALNVELLLDDEVIDMVADNIDVSIRVGWLHDSNLIARKLGNWPRYLCASPGYLEQYGRPESPAQLKDHEWIIFTRLPTPFHWVFTKNKRQERIQIKGRLRTNNAEAVHSTLLAGSGITAQAAFLVDDDIKAGRLERLLPEWECGSVGMYAVFQDRRFQQAKVRLFIDFICEKFNYLT